jgi:hypothetical protein
MTKLKVSSDKKSNCIIPTSRVKTGVDQCPKWCVYQIYCTHWTIFKLILYNESTIAPNHYRITAWHYIHILFYFFSMAGTMMNISDLLVSLQRILNLISVYCHYTMTINCLRQVWSEMSHINQETFYCDDDTLVVPLYISITYMPKVISYPNIFWFIEILAYAINW